MDITDELATQLLNAAPDPTVIVDQQGTIIYANARVKEVLGYTNQELVGEVIEVLIPERVRTGHRGHRDNFFENPRARAMGDTLELHAVRKDGVEIPVEVSLSPVETPSGTLVSSAIRDVSVQKEIAQQLVEAMVACGCKLNNAYMQHSLLALVVIPELRISDLGLVDVRSFKKIPVIEPFNE